MKNRLYAAGAVGIVVGFILGFFTAQFQKRELVVAPIQQTGAPQSSQSGLPQGHPPAEVLEELGKLQKRAEEHPEDKQVRIVLGNSYYDMGRFDAAVSWYQQALDLDPENLNVRTDLGTAQLYQGKVSEAIRTYKHCLKLDPQSSPDPAEPWNSLFLYRELCFRDRYLGNTVGRSPSVPAQRGDQEAA